MVSPHSELAVNQGTMSNQVSDNYGVISAERPFANGKYPSSLHTDEARGAVSEFLRDFDLSQREVDVYLGLLRIGPSPARNLSELLRINRVDTYRLLGRLSRRGLVTVTLGEPRKYESTRPRAFIRTLLAEVEERAQTRRKLAADVIMELEAIERLDRNLIPSRQLSELKLWTGKSSLTKFTEMLRGAEREILGVWPIGELDRLGALDPLAESAKRGVITKIICDLDKTNIVGSALWDRVEVRHRRGALTGLRFTVVDRKQVSFGVTALSSFENPKTLMSIWSNMPDLAELLTRQFEILWRRSRRMKPISSQIQKMGEGVLVSSRYRHSDK